MIFFHIFLALLGLALFQIQSEAGELPTFTLPDSNQIRMIVCKDGSNFIGRIVEIENDTLTVNTNFGLLRIPIQEVLELPLIKKEAMKKGKYWFPNPNDTRLFFAPTARMLPKGKGYFADYYVLFPSAAYGLTDRFTIGAGASIFPGVNLSQQIFFLTPKLGLISSKSHSLAIGCLFVKLPKIDNNGEGEPDNPEYEPPLTMGVLYGVGTIGNNDRSITFGLGYGFEDEQLAEQPIYVLGGEYRFSRKMALVSENWFVSGMESPAVSYGCRFFGEKMSVDLAFITPLKDAIFPGIPYIDFVVNF